MRVIGVAGLIGSGKSTVMRALADCGAACYDCDARAKFLMESSPELRAQIEAIFGVRAYAHDRLDREFLASLVFSDTKFKKALEGVVHPAVRRDLQLWLSAQTAGTVAVESAILIESGVGELVDEIWVVDAPQDVRRDRVIARDGLNTHQIESRMAAQMSRHELLAHATHVIDNGTQQAVEGKVMALFSKK